jgi:hypothetical protein
MKNTEASATQNASSKIKYDVPYFQLVQFGMKSTTSSQEKAIILLLTTTAEVLYKPAHRSRTIGLENRRPAGIQRSGRFTLRKLSVRSLPISNSSLFAKSFYSYSYSYRYVYSYSYSSREARAISFFYVAFCWLVPYCSCRGVAFALFCFGLALVGLLVEDALIILPLRYKITHNTRYDRTQQQ